MKQIRLFLFIIPLLFLMACNRVPLTEEQKVYAGMWQSRNGSWISISEDGAASLQLPNLSIEGGSIVFTQEGFTIGLGPIKKTFVVTEAPKRKDPYWHVMLNDVEYIRKVWPGE